MNENSGDIGPLIPGPENPQKSLIDIISVETSKGYAYYASTSKIVDNVYPNPVNDDSILVNPVTDLFVIADGMGGYAGGKDASQKAVTSIDTIVTSNIAEGKPALTIDTNRLQKPNDPESDTTLSAIIPDRTNNIMQILHVGDSRVYSLIKTPEGTVQLIQLTPDISFAYTAYPLFEPWASHLISTNQLPDETTNTLYVDKMVTIIDTIKAYKEGNTTLEDVLTAVNPDPSKRWIDPEFVQHIIDTVPFPPLAPRKFTYKNYYAANHASAGLYDSPEYHLHLNYPMTDNAIGYLLLTDGITDVMTPDVLQDIVQTEFQIPNQSEGQAAQSILRTMLDQGDSLRVERNMQPSESLPIRTKNDDQTAAIYLVKR